MADICSTEWTRSCGRLCVAALGLQFLCGGSLPACVDVLIEMKAVQTARKSGADRSQADDDDGDGDDDECILKTKK